MQITKEQAERLAKIKDDLYFLAKELSVHKDMNHRSLGTAWDILWQNVELVARKGDVFRTLVYVETHEWPAEASAQPAEAIA
jgi:hypothetical protein